MADRYQIRGKISQGGFGSVYKAWDTQLEREVAIKRLLPPDQTVAYDPKLILKEAGFLSKLQHPNIVTVYDLGEDDDGAYLVMEYVDGLNLAEYTENQVMSIAHFRVVAPQCLEGLMTAHSLNVLHRDIKPGNIMIRFLPSGMPQAKLLDFGLAKFSALPSLQTVHHGNILGSVYFMAPEQFERQPLDTRTDLYGLGCVFYYTLTGHRPFEGGTMVEVLDRHLNHEYIPVQQHSPEIPEVLANWVMRLMNRYPEDRPQSPEVALQEWQVVELWLKTLLLEPVPSLPNEHPAEPVNRIPRPNVARPTGNVPTTLTRRTGATPVSNATRRYGPDGASTATRRYSPGMTTRQVLPPAPVETEKLPWVKLTALVGSMLILSIILYVFWPKPPVKTGANPAAPAGDTAKTGDPAKPAGTAWRVEDLPKDAVAYFSFDQHGISGLSVLNWINGKRYPRSTAPPVPSFSPDFGDALQMNDSVEKWLVMDNLEWAAKAPGFTVALWFQQSVETSEARQQMTLFSMPGAVFSRSRLLLGLSFDKTGGKITPNVPRFGVRSTDEEESWREWRSVGHPAKVNEATHLAASVDYAEGRIRFYLNGLQVDEFTDDSLKANAGAGPGTPATALSLGDLHDSGQGRNPERFVGLIDDALIFSRALTADEVKKIAQKSRAK